MEETERDAGKSYELGLAYLTAARKILVVARYLEDSDKEFIRRVADGFVLKGTEMLTRVVRPKRSRRQPAPASGEGGSNPE